LMVYGAPQHARRHPAGALGDASKDGARIALPWREAKRVQSLRSEPTIYLRFVARDAAVRSR